MVSFVIPFTGLPNRTKWLSQRRGRCSALRHNSLSKLVCVADKAVFTEEADGCRGVLNPSFPERASGEWFGYEVAFSARTGAALNIEDRFIPEVYREWDVEVKGFDTVTSTQVTTAIYQKRTRALPTVGCEADAVIPDVFTCEYENVFGFRDGSFCAGPFRLAEPYEWSFTLVDPCDQQNRARIEFGRFEYEDGITGRNDLGNGKVTVFIERREAEFCDGQVLPGCGGSGGFAHEEPMDLGEVNGTWNICSEVYTAKSAWQPLETNQTSTRDNVEKLISTSLPRGLSVGIYRSEELLNVVVGWLRGNLRVVLRRVYNEQGTLLSVSRELETRQRI